MRVKRKICHTSESGPLNQKAFSLGVSHFQIILDSIFFVPNLPPTFWFQPLRKDAYVCGRTVIQFQSPRLMKSSSWVKAEPCLLIIIVSPSFRKDTRAWTKKSVGLLNFPSHKIAWQRGDLAWLWLLQEWTKIWYWKLSSNLYLPLLLSVTSIKSLHFKT